VLPTSCRSLESQPIRAVGLEAWYIPILYGIRASEGEIREVLVAALMHPNCASGWRSESRHRTKASDGWTLAFPVGLRWLRKVFWAKINSVQAFPVSKTSHNHQSGNANSCRKARRGEFDYHRGRAGDIARIREGKHFAHRWLGSPVLHGRIFPDDMTQERAYTHQCHGLRKRCSRSA
jgi:hypothetical protein